MPSTAGEQYLATLNYNLDALEATQPDFVTNSTDGRGGGFFSTSLSLNQMNYWAWLICMRAFLSAFAFAAATVVQAPMAFGVPPAPASEAPGALQWSRAGRVEPL